MLTPMKTWTPQQWAEHDARVRTEQEAERARLDREMETRLVGALEIPPRILDLVRGDLKPTEAMGALKPETMLVCLSGNTGTGKTVTAAHWLYTKRVGLFVKASRLSRWERYDDAEMDRLLKASRLVIDDLGTEYQDVKGNFMAILDEVIDTRYDHRLATVLTTNLKADEFKLRYGDRIADRIREVGEFVRFGTASMRVRTP